MYSVYYYFDKTPTGGYHSCSMGASYEFYVIALTDVIIEWISNRNVKCAEIFNNETKKLKLHWKRN